MPFITKKTLTHQEKRYNLVFKEIERDFHLGHPVRHLCEMLKTLYTTKTHSDKDQTIRFDVLFDSLQVFVHSGGLGPSDRQWMEEAPSEDDKFDALGTRIWNAKKRASLSYIQTLQSLTLEQTKMFQEENKQRRKRKKE